MVGLVIVSHSNALSQALAGLVQQVAAEHIPLCGVGGVGPGNEAFGTDACAIAEAIESVYSPDGVVVLDGSRQCDLKRRNRLGIAV